MYVTVDTWRGVQMRVSDLLQTKLLTIKMSYVDAKGEVIGSTYFKTQKF
jgi:hypothetical protein